jgi:hypothetical protein
MVDSNSTVSPDSSTRNTYHARAQLATQVAIEIPLLGYQILDAVEALDGHPNDPGPSHALLRALASRVCTLGQVSFERLAEDEASRPIAALTREVTHG